MAKKASDVQNGDLKQNVVILRSVYGKVGQQYFIQPQKDKRGRLPECVRRVDSNGDMILSIEDRQKSGKVFIPEDQIITIGDGTTFDLNDPYQEAVWEAVKNCFLIAPTRDAKDPETGDYLIDGTTDSSLKPPRYGRAELYVEIPGAAAQRRNTRGRLVVQAKNFIINDERGYDGQMLIAKVLGRNMANAPAADVEDYLFSVAEKSPDKIIELYTGGDLSLKLLLITAKEKKVIRKEHGMYIYGDEDTTILGASDAAIIEWMKQPRNQRTLQMIRQDTYPDAYVGSSNPA